LSGHARFGKEFRGKDWLGLAKFGGVLSGEVTHGGVGLS
jgi:hypothetical protein